MKKNPYGRENVRKGIGHYVTGRALAAAISLVVVLLLVRTMAVEDYGVFVTATGVATIIVTLTNCGLDRVVLKFLPEGRINASASDLSSFVVRMVGLRMSAVIALLIPIVLAQHWLFALIQIPTTAGIVIATATYTVLLAFTDFSLYCLQALMLQRQLRLSVTVAWIARLLAVACALLANWPLSAGTVLWIWAICELLAVVILAAPLLALIQAGRRDVAIGTTQQKWPGSDSRLRALATSNFLSTLVGIPWQPYALRTIAGALLPVQQVAAYGFFQILVERVRGYLPVYFFASLTEPLMSAHMTEGEEKQRVLNSMAIVVQASMWLLAPVVAIFAVVGEPAVQILTGGKYGGFSAILALLFSQILLGVQVAMLWSFFSVLGESRAIWRAVLMPSVFVFPLLIVCGLSFGMLGMALAAPLNTLLVLIIMLGRLRQMGYAYPLQWVLVSRILVMAILVPLPAWGLVALDATWASSPLAFLAMLLMGGVAYLGGSFRFPPFCREQSCVISKLAPGFAKFINR